MTPRRYDMSRREQDRAATRQRIIEATARLHSEHGVFGTSWKDIAREADVAVATVYAHFPSLDELLPACGAHVMALVRPPGPQDAAEVVGDATGAEERLGRAAASLFAFYERGGASIEVDVRERRLAGMREWEQYLLDLAEAFTRHALGEASDATVRLVSALVDLSSFKAMRARGIDTDDAAQAVARIGACLADHEQEAQG